MASNLEPKINRIATAVTSALSALTEKGVTVPDGANVESLAALIESIEAGGGGGGADFSSLVDATACVSGTVTPSSNVTTLFIYDDFSTVYTTPRLVILFSDDAPRTAKMNLFIWINTSGDPKADGTDGFAFIGHNYSATSFWVSASRINEESNQYAHINHAGNSYYYDRINVIQSRVTISLATKKPSPNYGEFSAGATYKYLVIGS